HFADAAADFRTHADISRLQRPRSAEYFAAPVQELRRPDAHQHHRDQNRYEDFFLHKTFSLLLHPYSFALYERGPFGAAMPLQTTSNVVSIQACRSEGPPTPQIASVPNMACWKIRANSSGARSVRTSPSLCPRSMMVAMVARPSSRFFWKTSLSRLV